VSAGEVTLYGVVAEFVRPDEITAAARRLRSGGYSRFDAFTPVPLEELDEIVVPRPRVQLALILLAAWLAGAILTYVMQYVAAVIDYPLNVGGRPLNSWPAFVPICWEIGALWTVLAGAGALALFCRLPRLHHPIFDAPGFARASQDRFFLCVEASDPWFSAERVSSIFAQYGAVRISEVLA
jgi:hypothetical protein